MRSLLGFLLLCAVAVTVALFAKVNAGYVLFVAPPYRLELSLNAFIVVAVLAFLFVYGLLRFAGRVSRLPRERLVGHDQEPDAARPAQELAGRHAQVVAA